MLTSKNAGNKSKPELMIDYGWRQDLNLTMDYYWDSRKLNLDCHKVKAVNIHFHGGVLCLLHVNHYKRKDNGVFNMKYDGIRVLDIIENTRFRNEYRDRIVEQLTSFNDFWHEILVEDEIDKVTEFVQSIVGRHFFQNIDGIDLTNASEQLLGRMIECMVS